MSRQGDLIGAVECLAMAGLAAYIREKNWLKLSPGKRRFMLFGSIFLALWGLIQLLIYIGS